MSGSGRLRTYKCEFYGEVQCTSERLDLLQPPVSQWKIPYDGYKSDEDEGHVQQTPLATSTPIPPGASLQTALRMYQRCEADWNKSDACTQLRKTFNERIVKESPRITQCICFGLGSPTRTLGANVSMYQLAAFKTVIGILRNPQGQPPKALFQEPVLNDLDKQLLNHLKISVVHHPAGFHAIDATALVYCAFPPVSVVRGVLERLPAIFMGSELDLEPYRDIETGQKLCDLLAFDRHRHPELSLEEIKQKERSDAIKGAALIAQFKRGKKSVALPHLSGGSEGDWVFQGVHVHWKSSSVRAATPSRARVLEKKGKANQQSVSNQR